MSETETQNEPSMEEILASIRRIISEDDSDKPAENATAEKDDGEVVEDGSIDSEADVQELDDEDDGGDEEPVELTRMVDQSGQVVDLKADGKAADADQSGEEEDEDVSSKGVAEKLEESLAEALEVEAEAATQKVTEDAVELVDKKDEPEAAVAPAPVADAPVTASTGPEADGLVSANTKKAAAASLAQVISAVAVPEAKPQHPVGGERSLEAVVRDALQPELRAWLDANLAPLVERIVREEIKKLVRRAEDN